MSSLEFDDQLISKSLPISELIKRIKHCFRERDFDELQGVLMEREEDLKMEIENLKRGPHSAEKVVGLLDRNGVPVVLERLQYDEELGKSQRKCHVLEELVTRLNEEKRLLTDRVKLAEERSDRIFTKNMIMTNEKNKLISELNEKIKELENKNLEKIKELENKSLEKIRELENKNMEKIRELKNKNLEKIRELENKDLEKIKELENKNLEKIRELENKNLEKIRELKNKDLEKIKELENKNLEKIRELKNKNLKKIRELKNKILKKIEELENKNLESERLAGVYREKCACLDSIITKMDHELEDLRQKKSEEVNLANKTIEELRMEKIESDKKAELFESRPDAAVVKGLPKKDDRNSVPPRMRVATDSAHKVKPSPGKQSGRNPPQEENHEPKEPLCSGDRTSVPPRARACIDELKVKASSGKQSGHSPPQEVNHEPKEPLFSGVHTRGKQLLSSSRISTCSSPAAAGAIIEIGDSDDETNPDGVTHISNSVFLDTKVVKNKANLVPGRLSTQTSKGNRTDCVEGQLTAKRKRDVCMGDVDNTVSTHEKENQNFKPARFGIDSSHEKINVASDEDSEDESLSDSKMMELVKNLGRKLTCEADMLKAFQRDEVFCLSAVCALYRQQLKAKESKGRLNLSKYVGFRPYDSLSGCALAKYLIDGDKELRMRKSVSEVKKQHPEIIGQCRKLAYSYVEKLFAIHLSAVDPFFGQS